MKKEKYLRILQNPTIFRALIVGLFLCWLALITLLNCLSIEEEEKGSHQIRASKTAIFLKNENNSNRAEIRLLKKLASEKFLSEYL